MYHGLIRVHHLLQVDGLVAVVREGGIAVEVLVCLYDVLGRRLGADDGGAEDAAGEVATVGDEVDVGIQIALHLFDALFDFGQMLVGKGLVDAQVVVAPREVRGGTGLLSGSRGTRDGIHADVLLQQVEVGGGQQSQLDAGGEAAGVGYVLGVLNLAFIDFRQSVDIVMVAFDAEVLRQVDNLHVLRDGVLLQELLALAVAEAEEDYIHLLEGHLVGKREVRLANESLMHVAHQIAGVTL